VGYRDERIIISRAVRCRMSKACYFGAMFVYQTAVAVHSGGSSNEC